MKRQAVVWTIAGAIFIIFLGSFLHFAYELSGEFKPLALIEAVNESTWEHLKLAYWPAIIFYLIEFFRLRKSVNNFLLAKTVALYVMSIVFIAVLWVAVLATISSFWGISTLAAVLLAPYLAWSSFAAPLNFYIRKLNSS